jgi:hypothetical protein
MVKKATTTFVELPSYYPHSIMTDGKPLELDPHSQLTQQANLQEDLSVYSEALTD